MAMSRTHGRTLADISEQMRTMSAEMRAFSDGIPIPAKATGTPMPVVRPVQLQINQSGSWRSALDFDLDGTPPELLASADQMARLCGEHTTMRVVRRQPNGSGGLMTTREQLMHWSREKGWVNA